MEEAVKELTAQVSSGPNWPYTLARLNEDTCHVPLPKEGHLGILPEGGTNSTLCRRISQLEVCQLLISGLQVAYPVGLNGCKDPIITPLPKSLANDISLTGGGYVYLEVDIPQPMVEEPEQKVLPLGRCSSILIASPLKYGLSTIWTNPCQARVPSMEEVVKELTTWVSSGPNWPYTLVWLNEDTHHVPLPKEGAPPLKLEREVSMTMKIRSLLSWVMLDTSGHMSGNSTPKY